MMRFFYVLWVVAVVLFAPSALLFAHSALALEAGGLTLPLDCVLGESCWIPNYVDLKLGKGVVDYTCGDASYDAEPGAHHKGTDFAVRDLAAVQAGVAVRAAAAGRVLGVRDGEVDAFYDPTKKSAVQSKECGNGVRIEHKGGITTQYCHLRKGSVQVVAGAHVAQGQHLGWVGLSGQTAFPHLHFQVEQGKAVLDPFAGLNRKAACGVGEAPLWDQKTLDALPYQPTAIYHVGFAPGKPDRAAVKAGTLNGLELPTTAPALVVWAELFRVRAGDKLQLTITDPGGVKIHDQSLNIEANKASYWAFSGLRLKQDAWPSGTYRGDVRLIRSLVGGRSGIFSLPPDRSALTSPLSGIIRNTNRFDEMSLNPCLSLPQKGKFAIPV